MLTPTITLRINAIVLFLAALMDLRRGIAHTYQVRYSAEQLAGIAPIEDSLFLMGAFGVSNFLTAFLYLLILWKARSLAPYVLLLIPLSYFIGGIGIRLQAIQPEGAFIGQYMMAVYISICLLTASGYFLSRLLVRSIHRS